MTRVGAFTKKTIDANRLPITTGSAYRGGDKWVQRDSLKALCYVFH